MVEGSVTNLLGQDAEGNALSPTGTLIIDAPISETDTDTLEFGTVMGTVTLPDGDYDLSGSFDGAFGGDGATTLLGQSEGTVTNPDNSQDTYSGLWYTEKD